MEGAALRVAGLCALVGRPHQGAEASRPRWGVVPSWTCPLDVAHTGLSGGHACWVGSGPSTLDQKMRVSRP